MLLKRARRREGRVTRRATCPRIAPLSKRHADLAFARRVPQRAGGDPRPYRRHGCSRYTRAEHFGCDLRRYSGTTSANRPTKPRRAKTMDSHSAEVGLLGLPLVLLAAAVVSVPLARFARLSAIVAYLLAGIVLWLSSGLFFGVSLRDVEAFLPPVQDAGWLENFEAAKAEAKHAAKGKPVPPKTHAKHAARVSRGKGASSGKKSHGRR